jgi:hypothetical protein
MLGNALTLGLFTFRYLDLTKPFVSEKIMPTSFQSHSKEMRRSNSALPTTVIELNAMANPANSGLSVRPKGT